MTTEKIQKIIISNLPNVTLRIHRLEIVLEDKDSKPRAAWALKNL